MEAASEVTRGRGAADEEEGYVGGLPGVREGSFCACQSDCTSGFLHRIFTESLKTTVCLPLFSFLGSSFLVSTFFPLPFLLFLPVLIPIECAQVPRSSICWNYLPVLAAGGGRLCVS